MKVTLPYGKEFVNFHVPDKAFIGLLDPLPVEPTKDPKGMIRDAIRHPIGTGPLGSIVSSKQKIAILIDDASRPTPVSLILQVLLEELLGIGVLAKNISIIAALGSHRYMSESELCERVGEEIYKKYRVINSEFRDTKRLTYVGNAPDGVAIYATKEVIEADIRIGVGNIVPHPVMGWSGGGKILYPGVAGEKTVAYFHLKGSLIDANMFGSDHFPIREMMEQWVDTIGLHFIINTILTVNAQLFRIVTGDYVAAHRAGVTIAKSALGRAVPEPANVMVVSSHPADQDFWQSPKGMYAAEPGLCGRRGTIILVSPNEEGIGPHREVLEYMRRDDGDNHIQRFMQDERFANSDALALAIGNNMSKLRRRQQLVVVSDGVTKEEMNACGCKHYNKADIQKAVDEALAEYPGGKLAALSNGGETFLYY